MADGVGNFTLGMVFFALCFIYVAFADLNDTAIEISDALWYQNQSTQSTVAKEVENKLDNIEALVEVCINVGGRWVWLEAPNKALEVSGYCLEPDQVLYLEEDEQEL